MDDTAIYKLLRKFRSLQESDIDILSGLLAPRPTTEARVQMLNEGDPVEAITLLQKGWAMRYKTLPDGRRQILNFLLPGDLFGLFGSLFERSEFGVATLTPISSSAFSFAQMLDAFGKSPRLALALTWLAGQDERQLDEQIMRIGRRTAGERMAHLFMELHFRLSEAGVCGDDARHFPLTQSVLADTLGMSHVHANRSFRALVKRNLVALTGNGVHLADLPALADLANFDAAYLDEVRVPPQTERIFPG